MFIEATNELMKHKDTNLILATGGMLVKSAHSSGTPTGVGPGNGPALKTADVLKAVRQISD